MSAVGSVSVPEMSYLSLRYLKRFCFTCVSTKHFHFEPHRLPELTKDSMAHTSVPPPNFSWVEPQKLAGLAWPSKKQHYHFLIDNGIKHLVCLCESKPPQYDSVPELTLHHLSIVDFTPPSLAQIQRFLSIVEDANSKGQGVGVHCMLGQGRTGTMLACYLVKKRNLTGQEAIKKIRELRPGSIETNDQEQAVRKFQQLLHEKNSDH